MVVPPSELMQSVQFWETCYWFTRNVCFGLPTLDSGSAISVMRVITEDTQVSMKKATR